MYKFFGYMYTGARCIKCHTSLYYVLFRVLLISCMINWSRACPRSVYLRIQEIKSILNVFYHNQSNEANVWLTFVALDQVLRRLILVTYTSSQWRGKKFLIEHVVSVKTLNGRRSFFHFLLKLEVLEAKVKLWPNFDRTQK